MNKAAEQPKIESVLQDAKAEKPSIELDKPDKPEIIRNATCHHCGNLEGSYMCQWPTCGKIYCQSCLMRIYRYSKKALKKVRKMTNWGCPSCRKKCICVQCLSSANSEGNRDHQIPKKRTGVLLKREVEIINREAKLAIPAPRDAPEKSQCDFADKAQEVISQPEIKQRSNSFNNNQPPIKTDEGIKEPSPRFSHSPSSPFVRISTLPVAQPIIPSVMPQFHYQGLPYVHPQLYCQYMHIFMGQQPVTYTAPPSTLPYQTTNFSFPFPRGPPNSSI